MFNRQRQFSVKRTNLLDFARQLSARLGIRSGFTVVLMGDKAMRRYNRQFAGYDEATDVLSFPAREEQSDRAPDGEDYLGDILISVETADRQRRAGLDEELRVLVLHGVLHLLGHDHTADNGEMEKLEKQLKGEFSLS
ncbi:MAG: rRNA maturation RNase YbeY [Acidobacteria bacterium]|nr:MAG: rRNA maturation RNase YbeY [Acidobacteriota bacterium]